MKLWAKIALGMGGIALVFAPFIKSAWAKRNKVLNLPSSLEALDNLGWLVMVAGPMTLHAVRIFDPAAEMTSAYRNDEVNAGVGGSELSRHKRALALDYSISDPYKFGQWLRSKPELWPPRLKEYYAEYHPVHGHFEFWGPGELALPPVWKWEKSKDVKVDLP